MTEERIEPIRVDLHLHSTASDGQHRPAELVELAAHIGLEIISLTDHDTTEGIVEAQQAATLHGLTLIPGVEISTDVPGQYEIHILGYYIDPQSVSLQDPLTEMRDSRLNRAHKIWQKLVQLDCPVKWERIMALAGEGVVGRPHIAQAMVEANVVASIQEAFHRYIGKNGLAYVARPKLHPAQAIELIVNTGGVPVLAHPRHVMEHIPKLVKDGLRGLEVYYSGYPQVEIDFLLRIADKHGLIATGGSDYHGPDVLPSSTLGGVYVPLSAAEQLKIAAGRG